MSLKDKNNKVLILIKRLVKEEVDKKINVILKEFIANKVKPIIYETISKQLLEIMLNNNSNKNSLNEILKNEEAEIHKKSNNFDKSAFRRSAMEKLGINNNPSAATIFEDIEVNGNTLGGSISESMSPDGSYIDSDDEGISLEMLGIKSKM